jgi:hypothetical protein
MNSALQDQSDILDKLYVWKNQRTKEIGRTVGSTVHVI